MTGCPQEQARIGGQGLVITAPPLPEAISQQPFGQVSHWRQFRKRNSYEHLLEPRVSLFAFGWGHVMREEALLHGRGLFEEFHLFAVGLGHFSTSGRSAQG